MAHNVTINTVGNALGQYAVRYSNRINQTLKQNLEFEMFLPKVSCDYAYQGQDVSHSTVLQPYQKAFTPNNSSDWDGHLNILQVGKIDLSYDWDEMQKFMDKWRVNWFEAGKPEADWTFPRYMIENVVMPQFMQDVNLASYNGVYSAPTSGTAGSYLDTWNGFKTYIEQFILAGKIAPIVIGALGDNTAVEQVRDFCMQLPQLHRFREGIIYMSKTNALKYALDYEAKYPRRTVNIDDQNNMYMRVDKFNKRIVGLNSMEGSERLILQLTGSENMIVGTKAGFPSFPQLRFDVQKRQLDVIGEFWRFYGFETLLDFFVSDAA